MAKYIENQDDDDEVIELEDRGDDIEDDDEDVEVENEVVEEDVSDEEEIEEDDEVNPYQERIDALLKAQEEQAKTNQWLQSQLEKLISGKDATPVKDPEPTFDYEAAEETYAQLLIENEFSKAAKLRSQIDSARRAEMLEFIRNTTQDTNNKAKAYSSEAIIERDFQSLIDNLESTHDFLNPKSKKYNAEAVETINTMMAGYAAAGNDKVTALKLAVKKAAPLYKTPEVTKSIGDVRKQAAGKKAVAAAKSQPIKTRSTSVPMKDQDTVDVFKMSDKEFSKLTDKEIRQLRGDF